MICTLILTVGMLAIAGLLGVTTQMELGAREAARSSRLAQQKMDELMRSDFDSAAVAVGGSLANNATDHYEANPDGLGGVTIRWVVEDGPTGADTDTRILTVRVVNLRAQQYRNTDISTIIRDY